MAAPQTTPCEPWPVECADFPDSATPELIATATMAATEALWKRTKQRFGFCTMTLRPCRQECFPAWPWIPSSGWYDVSGLSWPFPAPALIGGQWFNIACGSCTAGCSCSSVSEVKLPYPVASVTEVKVDGVVLPSSAYRVDDWSLLVRLDGGEWPQCNDLNLADTEVGTWSVTAQYGEEVPELGQLAAGELSTQIVKRCLNDGSCSIPSATVKQVTRQGVTKVFFDSTSAFARGRIGLYWCDLFVSTYNPSGTGLASVFDVDGPRQRRVGT